MKTILVVDDFATVRLYHAHLLRQLGHAAETAADGEEALAVLRSRRVDMVLLDMIMPRMDGVEFLGRVRSLPGYETLPVLVISSESNPGQEEILRRAGVSGFMMKPAAPHAMIEMLQRFLG